MTVYEYFICLKCISNSNPYLKKIFFIHHILISRAWLPQTLENTRANQIKSSESHFSHLHASTQNVHGFRSC